ncbi:MAG: phenylalanine--tRNA ligase subunit alpha [Candidatus Geothermarchaeales archaeon]
MRDLDVYEGKALRVIAQVKRGDVGRIAELTGLNEDQVRKAVQGLKERGLVTLTVLERETITLGEKARELASKGMPERLIVDALDQIGGRAELIKLKEQMDLGESDFSAGLGKALENDWVKIWKAADNKTWVETTGKAGVKSVEELLIQALMEKEVVSTDDLGEGEEEALKRLLRRPRFVEVATTRTEMVEVTALGEKAAEEIGVEEVEAVTTLSPDLIKTGRWRYVAFKPYDLNAPSFPIFVGRRHPLRELIEEIREIFVSMGFVEIGGPLVELAFWNFDALFQPQDHPARDMQDTFYILDPEASEIPDRDLIDPVRRTHEDGWETGSTGWSYRWSLEEAEKLVLRTHTTVDTVRDVYEAGETPRKSFVVGNVFRNEKVTFKHTNEFFQVDGIVIDERANLRELMGVLSEFFRRLGMRKVRFWPSYFPYTEPSIQASVYVEKLGKWIELLGSGIFRPEVTMPLGVRWPVLAWGGGIERMAMIRYDVEDIRDLYRNDLGWLRRIPKRLSLP